MWTECYYWLLCVCCSIVLCVHFQNYYFVFYPWILCVSVHRLTPSFVVSAGLDLTIKLWKLPSPDSLTDASTPLPLHAGLMQRAHDKEIQSLAVSPNDQIIASGSRDKKAKVCIVLQYKNTYLLPIHCVISGRLFYVYKWFRIEVCWSTFQQTLLALISSWWDVMSRTVSCQPLAITNHLSLLPTVQKLIYSLSHSALFNLTLLCTFSINVCLLTY